MSNTFKMKALFLVTIIFLGITMFFCGNRSNSKVKGNIKKLKFFYSIPVFSNSLSEVDYSADTIIFFTFNQFRVLKYWDLNKEFVVNEGKSDTITLSEISQSVTPKYFVYEKSSKGGLLFDNEKKINCKEYQVDSILNVHTSQLNVKFDFSVLKRIDVKKLEDRLIETYVSSLIKSKDTLRIHFSSLYNSVDLKITESPTNEKIVGMEMIRREGYDSTKMKVIPFFKSIVQMEWEKTNEEDEMIMTALINQYESCYRQK